MIILLLIATAASCPTLECENLDAGICAVSSGDTISINSWGCPVGTYGLVTNLQEWYENGGTVYFCHKIDVESSNDTSVECSDKPTSEILQDGLFPKRCVNKYDCALTSGIYADCMCGLDGYSYCMPPWGSNVFDSYWEMCSMNENKTSYEYWRYWHDLHKYYNYYVAAPDCALAVFYEFVNVKSGEPSSGLLLMISGALLTVIYL